MTTTLAWVAVIISLPLVLILWATETKQQSARRLRGYGYSYQKIAARLHCSPTTARRLCLR